jgi:hypothetical protein
MLVNVVFDSVLVVVGVSLCVCVCVCVCRCFFLVVIGCVVVVFVCRQLPCVVGIVLGVVVSVAGVGQVVLWW